MEEYILIQIKHGILMDNFKRFAQSYSIKKDIEKSKETLLKSVSPQELEKSAKNIYRDASEYIGIIEHHFDKLRPDSEEAKKIVKVLVRDLNKLNNDLKDVIEESSNKEQTSIFTRFINHLKRLRKEIDEKFSKVDPTKMLASAPSYEQLRDLVRHLDTIHKIVTE